MQSASRDALATSRERLDGAADGLGAEELGRLADDLLGVAGVLVREPALRRALSDPSRSGADRSGLAQRVFGGHVGDTALDVLGVMVSVRWSRPSDLVEATERLGVDAVLIGAEQAGALAEVEDELFRFSRIVDGHPALAAALADETAAAERRGALVDRLLEGKARPATVRLARLAVSGFGGRAFETSLERLIELAAARRDRSVVRVRVAAPMTEQQERGLSAALGTAYGRQVSLQVEVDETLIGGAIVRIESDLYDGSVASRLAEARRRLTSL
jgi:F-type H+-transporting ATPase subunit delta